MAVPTNFYFSGSLVYSAELLQVQHCVFALQMKKDLFIFFSQTLKCQTAFKQNLKNESNPCEWFPPGNGDKQQQRSGNFAVKSGTSIIKEFSCMGADPDWSAKVEQVSVCGQSGRE